MHTELIQIPLNIVHKLQTIFKSTSVSDEQTLQTIRDVYEHKSLFLCPHSAVAVFAAQHVFTAELQSHFVTVCVQTANPRKFREIVQLAFNYNNNTNHDNDNNDNNNEEELLSELNELHDQLQSMPKRFDCLLTDDCEDWRSMWITKLKEDVRAHNHM